jgi:predicted PurR-regulated permease PerM
MRRINNNESMGRVEEPFRESLRVIGIYIRAQIVIAIILTVLYAVVFLIARVPFWPLIALAGGVTSFIPKIGSLVPLALAAIASLLGHRTLAQILTALGGWVLIQIAEGFYITPKLLSKPLGLKPLPVFLALLAGSFFFGPIGVLLAVPVLAVGLVFWRYFFHDRLL